MAKVGQASGGYERRVQNEAGNVAQTTGRYCTIFSGNSFPIELGKIFFATVHGNGFVSRENSK